MSNFLNVQQRWPSIETFKLETNYRSKPHIVEAGNTIIKMNTQQYDKEVVPHRTGEDSIRIFGFADEVDEAMQIIELIVKIKEEQEKQWSDFTILYRTNAQSSPFEQILLTDGIPYTVVGAFKFFERQEIKDIVSYVKYLLNPKDSIALKRIINTPSRKIGKTTIEQLEAI
jgi:DNA helicase-2/ATP-dependent DNA helicase PcrA